MYCKKKQFIKGMERRSTTATADRGAPRPRQKKLTMHEEQFLQNLTNSREIMR